MIEPRKDTTNWCHS